MISNPNKVVIVDPSTSATIEIMQPITQVVEVVTGPLGLKGDAGAPGEPGPQGPAGFSIFSEAGANTFATTSSLQITGSVTISGSSTFTNIGPAVFTGTVTVSNTIVANIISGTFSGSGAGLVNIPAGAVTGLSTSAITSESYSASISENGLQINTNVVALSFTGSLFGTASWANNVNSSSYALTSSYAQNVLSASYAVTASYFSGTVQNATSASYASTASFVQNAQTASYVLNAVSSSFATTASYALTANSGWVLISTANASGTSTVDFTGIDNNYSIYKVEFYEVYPASGTPEFWLRIGTDGTPTWQTSTYAWNMYLWQLAPGAFDLITGNNSDAQVKLTLISSTTSGYGISGNVIIYNPASSNIHNIEFRTIGPGSSNYLTSFLGTAQYVSSTAITGLRFLFNGSNTNGTFKLYGIK